MCGATENERPASQDQTPDAHETAVSADSVPATVRYTYDTKLLRRWADEPPGIAPGTVVELDLWGKGPAAYYARVLASWLLSLATGLEDLGASIERVLENIEQAEQNRRSPDDLVFWTAIIGRLLRIYVTITELNLETGDRVVLTTLIDNGTRQLLQVLRAQSRHARKPVTGLETPKALLQQAARTARTIGAAVDQATAAQDVKDAENEAITWHPFACDDVQEPSVLHGDNGMEVLSALYIAASKARIDLGTLEIGFTDNGSAVCAIRGVVTKPE